MCLALILLVILLPPGGAMIGYTAHGQTGAWIGALVGLAAALLFGGVPTGLYLAAEKKVYDRERDGAP
jgi:hypothetical protein